MLWETINRCPVLLGGVDWPNQANADRRAEPLSTACGGKKLLRGEGKHINAGASILQTDDGTTVVWNMFV